MKSLVDNVNQITWLLQSLYLRGKWEQMKWMKEEMKEKKERERKVLRGAVFKRKGKGDYWDDEFQMPIRDRIRLILDSVSNDTGLMWGFNVWSEADRGLRDNSWILTYMVV